MLLLATAKPSFSALRLWGGDSERLGDPQTFGEQEVYRGTWASLLSDLQPLGGSRGPRDSEQSPSLLPFLFPSTLQEGAFCLCLALFPQGLCFGNAENEDSLPASLGSCCRPFPEMTNASLIEQSTGDGTSSKPSSCSDCLI